MIKKLKIHPVAVLIIVGATLILKPDKKEKTFEEMIAIEKIADNTKIDEAINNGDLYYDEKDNILQAADRLERYLKILEEIKSVNLSNINSDSYLTDSEIEEMSLENVQEIVKKAKKGSHDQKKIAKINLKAIKKYCEEWEKNNIDPVCINLLIDTVKGSAAESLGTELEDVVIPGQTGYPGGIQFDQKAVDAAESSGSGE